MQLDLFSDNRRTILLNDADKMLRALKLPQALILYEELLSDYSDDAYIHALKNLVTSWCNGLSRFHAEPVGIDKIVDLWQNLLSPSHPPLATALYELLSEQLSRFPSPELIYVPPRFHLGKIMMAAGNFVEAERCFANALNAGIKERARFMAWQGDALIMLSETRQALDVYCKAFLEDPHAIDMKELCSPVIHDLLFSLSGVNDDSDEMDLLAWLPVWGWFNGKFGLWINEIAENPESFSASLDKAEQAEWMPVPQLWFNCLRYAEYLRTVSRDDRELVRVRRFMKQLNGFMFDRYMDRIRGH